jgi:enoyl-CoA hydratase
LEVEAVPRGCPPDFDFLPDLDTFYEDWLGRPLPDKAEYTDLTLNVIAGWLPPPYTKPLPVLEGFAGEFYGFVRDGELRFQRCDDCGTWRHPPREMCASCGSFDWEWARSTGKGKVFSWTVAERALHPEFVSEVPYAPTIVETEEGVRLLTQVMDVEPDDLEIGLPVEIAFDQVTNDVTLPKFTASTTRTRVVHTVPIESLELPSSIGYEKHGRIAIITIDRPEAMNSLTKDMLAALDRTFADFDADDDLWVAILTGAGDRAFCTGMDLKEAIPLLTSGDELGYEDHTKRQFSDIFKPVIAAVNGHCIAGGMEMLVGTDLRVAAEDATFGLGEVRWGLVPAGGSHIRMPHQIPWAVAMELLLTGETISADRAYEVGLLNRVVPAEQVMDAAMELAEKICRNGPLAVHTSKEIAVRALGLESGFVLEKALAAKVFASDDAKEGPRAFAEKRKPDFKGQ